MVARKAVTKIFGMFDRIDDIIYEPVRLVCDTLRQPLKQIDIHNEKKIKEYEQKLMLDFLFNLHPVGTKNF